MLANQLVNGNMYVGGNSWFGAFEECQLPDIVQLYEEHNALGQNAKTQFIVGMDMLKMTLTLNAPYANMEKLLANGYVNQRFQMRGNLEVYTGSQKTGDLAYTVFMEGTFMKKGGGSFKGKAKVKIETEVNVTYIKLVIGGQANPIYEIDVMNNIQIVDGVDVLAAYRANLGI